MKSLLLSSLLFCFIAASAQNIGVGNTNPHTKLEVSGAISSTPVSATAASSVTIPDNTSIFRLTAVAGTQANALSMAGPQEGEYLTIYNEDNDAATFAGYTVNASGGVITLEYIHSGWRLTSNNQTGPTGPAGGDLSGFYPIPTVIHLQGDSVSSATPHTGDVLLWTGTAWTPTADSGLNWKLIGNGGTNSAVNFIGTTDTQKLEFRVNSIRSGEIDGNGSNSFFGYQSGLVNAGKDNAGFGAATLKSCTTGGNNAGLGYQALYSNTTGNSNVAMGVDALYLNAAGGNLVAIGDSALYNNIGNFATPTGVYNVAVGSKALFANTTGYSNTAVGSIALYANTTGIYNTAVGRNALVSNTVGSYNTAVGHDALDLNNIGSNNTAVGTSTAYNTTSGANNTATGMEALFSDTSGSDNTASGYQSMFYNLTGTGNTATGWLTLPYNVTGNFNTAEGFDALYSHNTGDYNTGLGTEAMFYDSSGSLNVALGWRSLRYNKTGIENTALGVGALEFASPMSFNTAVGRGAGSALLGSDNTVIGIYAGRLDSASFVTAIGAFAGYNNKASYNTFLGSYSGGGNNITGAENTGLSGYTLYALTSGHSNTATGYGAMYINNMGSSNTANGTRSIYTNSTGSENTAIGDSSLFSNNTGNYNTAIGSYGLFYTTGSNNSALGYSAGPALAYSGLSNTTCIGANSTVTTSNSMILGDGTVNVGIGVTAPLGRLDVSYNSGITNPHIRLLETADDYARINYMNSNSTTKYWASAGYISAASDSSAYYNIYYGGTNTNIMSVTGNNRVGIMNTLPRTTLDLNGDFAYRTSNVLVITTAANNNVDIYTNKFSSYRITTSLSTAFNFSGFNGGSDGRIVTLYNASAQDMILQNQNALSNAAMEIITGISADLTVLPGGSVTMQYNGTDSRWVVIASNNSGNTNPAWNLTGNSNTTAASAPATYGSSTIASGQDWIGTTNTQDLVAGTNQIERMRIKQGTGYVGIGTATPANALDVLTSTASISAIQGINDGGTSGTGWGAGISFNGITGQAGSGSTQYQAGIFGYQIGGGANSGGVVGAYTSSIWGALGYTDASSNRWGVYSNSQAYINYSGDNVFLQLNTASTINKRTRINFSQTNTIGMELGTDYFFNNTTDLYIYNRATGSASAYFNPGNEVWLTARNTSSDFYITNAGRVGIGTTGPSDLLSVNGTANNSTGSWGVFSDARVKTVTGDFTDGLDVIRQIHPVRFRYKENAPFKADGEQIGIVAQELEKIAPYMVSQREYEKFKDLREVSNQAYVFLLINSIQEQQKMIEDQKAKYDLLEIKYEQLSHKLSMIEEVSSAQNNDAKEINDLRSELESLKSVINKTASVLVK